MSVISAMGGIDPAQRMDELQKKAQENFDAADTNEDGIVSSSEFIEAMTAQGIDSTKASEAFNALDANGDGEVSQEEHDKLMQDMQERMSAIMAKMDSEMGGPTGYGKADEEQQSRFDSFKSMLATIAEDTSDEDTANRLNDLLQQLQTQGYSKEGVKDSMELINKVAPPVNTTA
ncbi:EF-hand domain-containing protein [Neptunicella sp. SCSIO 80796]|uniref:EF-hand domain-containing protein n=1 Tax=Neptunicella plasticusilytica TaxID=3117012 RepID=UPI003A4E3CA1